MERTGGPVRSGKSTFITKFMENKILPLVNDDFLKNKILDELPQTSKGKTIMTVEEFIINYYLVIKKDNSLRQFILLHLSKVISEVCNIIETQLFEKMHTFTFMNNKSTEIMDLTHELAKKEEQLLKINPEKIADDNTEVLVKADKVESVKDKILNDLKASNPELETDNWI